MTRTIWHQPEDGKPVDKMEGVDKGKLAGWLLGVVNTCFQGIKRYDECPHGHVWAVPQPDRP